MGIRRNVGSTSKGLFLLSIGALLTATEARASDPVILSPGVMKGAIQLSPGFTITSGSIYAYSSDGYDASTSLSNGSYTLTVEGGHAYNAYVYLNLNNSLPSAYNQLRIYNYGAVPVPVLNGPGDEVQRDFIRSVANISGTVTVSGGTVTRLQVWANASSSSPNESYSAEVSYNNSASFAVPMVLDDLVTVDGIADITRPDGTKISVPFDAAQVNLAAGQDTVTWNIDLGALSLGAVEGSISSGDFSALSQHNIQVYGYGTSSSGVSVSKTLSDDGQFSFTDLIPGQYWVRAVSYFQQPYGQLIHPPGYTYINVAAGAITPIPAYGSPMAFLRGNVVLDGLRQNTDSMNYAWVRATHGSAPNAFGYDSTTLPAGQFDLALTAGGWRLNHYAASFYSPGTSSSYVNASFESRDDSKPPINLSAGDNFTGLDIDVMTTETVLIFDVAEVDPDPSDGVPPPPIVIASPQVTGNGPGGGYQGYKSFYAYGPSNAMDRTFVRVVAEPGTYQVTAYARVNGSDVEFKSFSVTLSPPHLILPQCQGAPDDEPDVNCLPYGAVIQPAPLLNLTLQGDILTPGYITAAQVPMGPTPPVGFKLAPSPGDPAGVYYNITKTAVFTGDIRICMPYNPALSPAEVVATMRPHYYSAAGGWLSLWPDNITVEQAILAEYLKTGTSQVCGDIASNAFPSLVQSLDAGSDPGDNFTLALLELADTDDDGVPDLQDNCPNGANDGQGDLDADGLGDACDDDADGDGVTNDADLCALAADPSQSDIDGDGLGDACDDDDDDDGLLDGADNCPGMPNPDQADIDGDGHGDACESDADGDGIDDPGDNCVIHANADQSDLDSDGVGDACDDDADGDGADGAADNCPLTANADQADLDGDGVGDACDDDDDADSIPDAADNCAAAANADQANLDGDALGDLCDADVDGDGADNAADNCPLNANAGQADLDGDGAGDACDDDDDADNIADATDNCGAVPNADQADLDGDDLGDACDSDVDGDGVDNAADNCALTENGDQGDLDGDGAGNACDADDDADGLPDASDNCPAVANAGQSDADNDGLGDACDADVDGDGVDDASDNCPLLANPSQADADSDGLGDACDSDDDGDGVSDPNDECQGAQGADADQDGCPDQAADLCALVKSMHLHHGTTQSLCAKANAAATASTTADAEQALDHFIHQVEQQRGKKIPWSQADLLVAFAENAQANLP